MFTTHSRIALVIGLVARVSGHAYVDKVMIGGTLYSGWLPFNDPYESPVPSRIVRKVPNDGPILDWSSADMACNKGGEEPAGATAAIQAGRTVQFIWSRWPTDHKGPVTVWMASCGSSCSTFKTSSAKWFAIDKAGMNADGSYATDDLIAAGASWTTTIPFNVTPGEYLLRIELLALHSIGAPQFYPSCSQIRVIGTGSGAPGDGEAVRIQDIYKGYSFPNIWESVSEFEIAGPAVATFVASPSPAPTHKLSPSMDATSSAHTPAMTIEPSAASPANSVPVNVIDPFPGTSRLYNYKLVRQRISRTKAKQRISLIDTQSFTHHKSNVPRHHRDFSY